MGHPAYEQPPTQKAKMTEFREKTQARLTLLHQELDIATKLDRERESIQAEIAVYKRMLLGCKSLPQQIQGASEALKRAEKRVEEKQAALLLAQSELTKAQEDHSSCRTTLNELKSMLEDEEEEFEDPEDDMNTDEGKPVTADGYGPPSLNSSFSLPSASAASYVSEETISGIVGQLHLRTQVLQQNGLMIPPPMPPSPPRSPANPTKDQLEVATPINGMSAEPENPDNKEESDYKPEKQRTKPATGPYDKVSPATAPFRAAAAATIEQ